MTVPLSVVGSPAFFAAGAEPTKRVDAGDLVSSSLLSQAWTGASGEVLRRSVAEVLRIRHSQLASQDAVRDPMATPALQVWKSQLDGYAAQIEDQRTPEPVLRLLAAELCDSVQRDAGGSGWIRGTFVRVDDYPDPMRVHLRPEPGNIDAARLGLLLRISRQVSGRRVDSLAASIGRSGPYVRMIERGEKIAAPDTYVALLAALGYQASLGDATGIPTVVCGDGASTLTIHLKSAASRDALLADRERVLWDHIASLESDVGAPGATHGLIERLAAEDPGAQFGLGTLIASARRRRVEGPEGSLYRQILMRLGQADQETLSDVLELLRSRSESNGGGA